MLKLFLKFSYGSWVSAVISFFTIPIITLLINPEQFGKASMFTLGFNILNQVVLFGTDQSFVRFFYEYEEKKRPVLLWNSIFPSLFVWVILSISIIFCWKSISIWLISEAQILFAVLLCASLLMALFNRYALLVVRMQKKGGFFSFLQIITSVINAVVIIIYAKTIANTFYAIIFGTLFSLFLTACVAIFKERKFWISRLPISPAQIKALLKYGIPFLPTLLMAMFFESMDKIFIRKYVGFEGLGLYAVAFKIVGVLTILRTGFSMFWIPASYEHYEQNPDDKTFYEKMYKYVLFILVICGLGLIAIKDIIILLLNKSYLESSPVISFLVFIPIMYTLSEITYLGINFTKKAYWHIIIFAVLLLLCPLFNYILVPLFGIKGAAMAVALSYISYFCLRTAVSLRLFPMNFRLINTAITFTMLFLVAGVNTFVANKVIGITCSIIAMLIFLLLNLSTIKDILIYIKKEFIPAQSQIS